MKKLFTERRLHFIPAAILFVLYALAASAQDPSKYIVVDQFGYLPNAKKVAIIRDPQAGFDADESFIPGSTYAVVDNTSGNHIITGTLTAWNSGATDASSGDKVWWFDFSAVTAPGSYYILDVDNNVRSYAFEIGENVYKEVLKHAVRTFFYQRAGHEKTAAYAGMEWADGASHTKNLQDKNARQYNKANDASTEVDVSGGWYDAGDYNKYTNWTANYVVDFMRAYLETPGAWSDDYNIPESGNNIPDLLDEAKWGIDHLLRMQKTDGSVLSIVGLSHASPPSSATGPSLYGIASTSATLNTAAAFALASKVYGSRGMNEYAEKLKESAVKAWDWAVTNPNIIFKNNDGASGTSGLGAGQQETDDYGRLVAKMEAACFLFEITEDTKYRDFFDNNYDALHLLTWTYAYPFETTTQEILLHYTTIPNATANVVNTIRTTYKNAMNSAENFNAYYNDTDPYRAYIKDYTWGSNSTKGSQGLMYMDMVTYNIDDTKTEDAKHAATGFLHYLHGVNPFNLVYLSNMYGIGAENSVNEFYHTWFGNGSAKWDRVGTSTYGPPPGFVTGGPNPSYDRDACCATNSCGGSNAVCGSENLTPPMGQPAQKSYKDFNTSWPLNSWSVTENSNGYQLNYIRLLSKFVTANYDCSGTENGTATYDICNRCAGGSTGIIPITDETECTTVTSIDKEERSILNVFPNPTNGTIYVTSKRPGMYNVEVVDALGKKILSSINSGNTLLNIKDHPAGIYMVIVQDHYQKLIQRVTKF